MLGLFLLLESGILFEFPVSRRRRLLYVVGALGVFNNDDEAALGDPLGGRGLVGIPLSKGGSSFTGVIGENRASLRLIAVTSCELRAASSPALCVCVHELFWRCRGSDACRGRRGGRARRRLFWGKGAIEQGGEAGLVERLDWESL